MGVRPVRSVRRAAGACVRHPPRCGARGVVSYAARGVRAGRAFVGFREPRPLPAFYPTYKRRPARRVPADRSAGGWVREVYHVQFKEPWYKGGHTRMRIPSFTDRILVHTRGGATPLAP
eukprot:gene9348-8926_t